MIDLSHFRLKPKEFLLIIVFLQFMAYSTVFYDVPVVRQVLLFLYLTFAPGFIILKLLELNTLNRSEAILFSVGLSIAFLFIAGLLVDLLGPLSSLSRPLSTIPLLTVLNGLILAGGILVYVRNGSTELKVENTDETPVRSRFVLLLSLPILSVAGATCVKIYGNNLILLFLIVGIALLFAFGVISSRVLPKRLYPLVVFIIAVSLLYHSVLVSNQVVNFGSDVPGEIFASRLVQTNGFWSPGNPYPGDFSVGRTYSMLSVTILPSIYSNLLNVDSVAVFMLFYPMLFALVPLGLYTLWSRHFGVKYAFAAAFLFMAYQPFYNELLGLNKQMIGELFLVLLLVVIFNETINSLQKTICFVLFSFGLVASHYALAEIFLVLISVTFVLLAITKRPRRNVTLTLLVLFFVLMFAWYIFTSGSSVYNSFLDFGNRVYNELNQFFNPESRGTEVLRGLGLEVPPTFWSYLSRVFAYLTEFFIAVGFFDLILRRKIINLKSEYLLIIAAAIGFLAALLIVPGLSGTMGMPRFYQALLFFIAPLFPIGVEFSVILVQKWQKVLKSFMLILLILLPYFLFQTGFVYEITKSPSWSIPLSKYRMSSLWLYREFGYIDEYSVTGAQWFGNIPDTHERYADDYSRKGSELRAYGFVYMGHVTVLSNVTEVRPGGVVYLSPANTVGGTFVGSYVWNTSELAFFQDLSQVYSNGESQIFQKHN